MSELFNDRLNTVHLLIDEGSVQAYEKAVEILQNLKTKIHDTEILKELLIKEDEIGRHFSEEKKNAHLKAADPEELYRELVRVWKWRAQQYEGLYDFTRIKHDL